MKQESDSFSVKQIFAAAYLLKWLSISCIVGVLSGSASALFLTVLDGVTNYRESNAWIIILLPAAGLVIGLLYYYYGKDVVRGNNLVFDEFYHQKKTIPFKMAPLVFMGTIITHLFGGSAGREGTAVQMGGAIADQFTNLFKLSANERKIILLAGISAGFASVFGTPLAGTLFALEVIVIGNVLYQAFLPTILSAYIAHYTCLAWSVTHTEYKISSISDITVVNILWCLLAGTLFGLTAILFSRSSRLFSKLSERLLPYPPLRPFIGGIIIAIAVWLIGTTKYIGLGIPTILESFNNPIPPYDFALKILFTAFTLGVGFKGGEVTPLFFIGATLGNALVWFIPLPISLLAGMGFVAVFAGATKTPIACIILGVELFGIDGAAYLALACAMSYFVSGKTGIYESKAINSTSSQPSSHL